MPPDERRDQILDAARRLFAERGYANVSTADVARAVGVTRALVHHYVGPKREVFLAVVSDGVDRYADLPMPDPALALAERAAVSIDTWLDFLAENRETWLATAALGDAIPDPEVRRLIARGREAHVERSLRTYADVVDDTPSVRFALRSWQGLNQAASRQWLLGEASREDVHAVLTEGLLALLRRFGRTRGSSAQTSQTS